MRPFLVCVHDVTPAHARATLAILRDLRPAVGRRVALGVVPNWHGAWPLTAYPDFCRLVRERADELLLHGHVHRRRRGRGLVSWLTGGADEMSGLDARETAHTLAHAQRLFAEAFGETARGFLAPAWQRGRVGRAGGDAVGLEHVLGFASLASLASRTGRTVPLATWTWDCGRWGPLGHVGHGVGQALHRIGGRVPTLAIHPRDLERGFWPRIARLVHELRDAGYEPTTCAALLEAGDDRAAA